MHDPHDDSPREPHLDTPSPPRAFTQGLGTLFQVAGVTLFLVMTFICCGSSLLSKDTATKTGLTTVGWRFSDKPDAPIVYSAQRATTLAVFLGVFFGIALSGVGLGLQAQNRRAPLLAVLVTVVATAFWVMELVFFASVLHSILLVTGCTIMSIIFGTLLLMSLNSFVEMQRNPTPAGFELLPADYKIPYSHYHQDPPEVRLARELDQRRERLELQQKELEMLEEKLRKKMEDKS